MDEGVVSQSIDSFWGKLLIREWLLLRNFCFKCVFNLPYFSVHAGCELSSAKKCYEYEESQDTQEGVETLFEFRQVCTILFHPSLSHAWPFYLF